MPRTAIINAQEIKKLARQAMQANGTAGISLRAIAREAGVTAPAIYNYYPRLDDLITALIVDAFNAFGDAMEAADDQHLPLAHRLRQILLMYRGWASSNRTDFQLIYGNPIPNYHAPAELTSPLSFRTFAPILRVVISAYHHGLLVNPPPGYHAAASALTLPLQTYIAPQGAGLPPAILHYLISAWARMHGIVMLEMFGHLSPSVGDIAAFYEYEIYQMLDQIFVATALTDIDPPVYTDKSE
jgi:AcrR family transcriptional regulator